MTLRITAGAARACVLRLLAPYPRERETVADALTGAQHAGRPEFGLDLLARELRGVAGRRAGARDEPAAGLTVRATAAPAVRCVDGAGVPGPVPVAYAARVAGELAAAYGVGLVAARGVTGAGRLAPYTAAQARAGRVALLFAQAPPSTAPHGGHSPVLGTNPLAYAFPREGGRVLAADAATAALTQADLAGHRDRGVPLPTGRALAADGTGTTDPAAVHVLLPSGGLLGTVTGLLVEALAGALPAARGEKAGRSGRGVLCVVIAPEALGVPGSLSDRVEELARELRAAGGHVPGEREIPVPDDALLTVSEDTWAALNPAP